MVRDGEVVGRGFHTWAGVKHAEVLALEEAGEKARGATHVRHAGAVHASRPDASVHRCDSRGGRAQGGRADGGSQSAGGRPRIQAAARRGRRGRDGFERRTRGRRDINEAFLHFMRTGRPLVTLKAAMTLDGKIAAPDDETAPGDSLDHQRNSAGACADAAALSDAILTGIGTVLSDNCRLTDRTGRERSRPLAAHRARFAAAAAAGLAHGSILRATTYWR